MSWIQDLFAQTGIQWRWAFSWTGYKKPMNYKHFTDEEAKGLDSELMCKLDTARELAGIPFIITSGLRSCAANAKVLGVEHSAHIQGKAVDLGLGHLPAGAACDTARYKILSALLTVGFQRIGIYQAHIHCDVGQIPDYAQQVMWFSEAA